VARILVWILVQDCALMRLQARAQAREQATTFDCRPFFAPMILAQVSMRVLTRLWLRLWTAQQAHCPCLLAQARFRCLS
jgi:hypothetical protein